MRKRRAAALDDAALTTLHVSGNNIGDEGARALVAALDTNRMLQQLDLYVNNTTRTCEPRGRPSSRLQARSQGRLVDLTQCKEGASSSGRTLSSSRPLLPAGRHRAGATTQAAYLLLRAEAALREEVQRRADATKKVREGERSSSSRSRVFKAPGHA